MRVELNWDGDDCNHDDYRLIEGELTRKGYCLISCSNTSEDLLLQLAPLFGPIQQHERSELNGVALVSNKPNAPQDPDLFQGLSDKALAPHSDGAYLDFLYIDQNEIIRWVTPPAIIMLQCVEPAAVGGDSVLIDGAKIFRDVWFDPEMYDYLFHSTVQIERAQYRTEGIRLYQECRNGQIAFRFRDKFVDLDNDSRSGALKERFVRDYLTNDNYRDRIALKAGDILLIDNIRMLHAREAFSCLPDRYRTFRRLWIADRWGYLANAPILPSRIAGAALLKEEDQSVRNYRWHDDFGIQAPRFYRINPSLGIRPLHARREG